MPRSVARCALTCIIEQTFLDMREEGEAFMVSLKKMAMVFAALMIGGCSCHAHKVGPAENVPVAAAEGDLKDIHFAFDSYQLDATARSLLTSDAQWLKDHSGVRVQIEGHCDERGTAEYNMALGQRRAQAALEYVRSLGVDGSRLSTVSYGKELPLDPGHNEAAWAKNRRAHFNTK
jgi:peptidoglycan-associated lipoprotein